MTQMVIAHGKLHSPVICMFLKTCKTLSQTYLILTRALGVGIIIEIDHVVSSKRLNNMSGKVEQRGEA